MPPRHTDPAPNLRPPCSYRAALREFPGAGCPAEVRLGIAACAFKLGDLATSRAAYQRVLALDPDCADAYLGLAVLAASDANVQQASGREAGRQGRQGGPRGLGLGRGEAREL
jgi:hypothetical protein